jgi:agmatine/peptidylarginine deiminase
MLTSVRAAAAAAGEFEKHAGCWMGWPYDKYLWREDALPAKKQYAAGRRYLNYIVYASASFI